MIPPALARMSGITMTPEDASSGPADKSIGPLEASAMILALTSEAFRAVICPPLL